MSKAYQTLSANGFVPLSAADAAGNWNGVVSVKFVRDHQSALPRAALARACGLKSSSVVALMCIAVLMFVVSVASSAALQAQESVGQASSSTEKTDSTQVQPAGGKVDPTAGAVVGASSEVRVAKAVISSAGFTQVGLEYGMDRLLKGLEPQTLDELRALEAQQAKVAEKVKLVTVNVQQGNSQGSGVVISQDGYVLTAAHVAGKPNLDATVVFSNGRRYQAKTLGMNRNVDAGLLKITDQPAEGWPHATLGESNRLSEGQWCVAVGHPGGWQEKRGSVIRVGRVLAMLPGTIVTDCSLIGGDSGGPLFDLTGRLIGIHSRIGAEVTENMHVPVDEFTRNFERLVSGEKWGVLPGYEPAIGITGDEKDGRAIVSKINAGGPADRAGLQEGDLITNFDGTEIRTFKELREAVHGCLPGDHVRIEISRNEQKLSRTLVIGLKN